MLASLIVEAFIMIYRSLFLSLSMLFFSVSVSASCSHFSWDKTATVKYINDGDTITLTDGQLVRFIGINTPEINHRNLEKSDPYALDARKLLARYVREGDKVHLIYDKTKRDKYGRVLAYVYSKTGRNLGELQLQAGFAQQWVVGNNDHFWQCFQVAEKQARNRKKGIWADWVVLNAAKITKKDKGYHYIEGRITELKENGKGLSMVLDKKITVSISSKRLKKFNKAGLHFVQYQKVRLTGKIIFKGRKAKMTLYHPVQVVH